MYADSTKGGQETINTLSLTLNTPIFFVLCYTFYKSVDRYYKEKGL